MKRDLFFALVFCYILPGLAANGDTTHVRSHDKVLIQTDPSRGSTDYKNWAVFPKPGKTYSKMYAELTFQCPPGMTCGEWDYLNYIFIGKRRGSHNDSLGWEVMRVITPYGLQFPNTWIHTWRFDISDFASLFTDSIEVWYQHTGYEARNGRGWLVTLDFTMIEGPEVRPVKSIVPFYRKGVGYANDTVFNANVPEVTYTTGPNTSEVRYKILQTGHGSDKPDNCGEFCPKVRYIFHDGKMIDTSWVWRDDCGSNPISAQGGTWVYDRANWCPGADVREYNLDVKVDANSTHKMDLSMQHYVGNGGGNYMLTVYKIEYGNHTFNLDASIEDIISPSEELRYKRLNPVCSNPKIVVRNNGNTTINKIRFDYGWKGHQFQTYVWQGALETDKSVQMDLPPFKSFDSIGGVLQVKIVAVNNLEDYYKLNNIIETKPVLKVTTIPDKIIVIFKTNNAPTENYYTVKKADGTVMLDRKNFTAINTSYRDTLHLTEGCYILNLMDDGPPPANNPLNKDGLYWWANPDDGTGIFMLRNGYNNAIIKNFATDFGTGIWFQMRVGNSILPSPSQVKLNIFPNPVHHSLMIDLGQNCEGILEIKMTDAIGRKVLEQKRKGPLDALQFLDVTVVSAGVYFLSVKLGNDIVSQKIIID